MATEQSRRTVTIVINTFNQTRFLREAIASAIRQRHPADNIIVVENGSTVGGPRSSRSPKAFMSGRRRKAFLSA
jgi:GT2 family glycosyltransferase